MAQIQLIDLGYVDKSRTTTASSVVNGGSPVSLPTAKFELVQSVNVDNTPSPGVIGSGVQNTNLVSVNPETYLLRVSLRTNDPTDQTIIKHLLGVKGDPSYPGVCYTRGLKAIIISGVSDSNKTVVELVGSTSTLFHGNEITSGLPALLCYVVKARPTNTGVKNVIDVSLECVEV